MPDENPLPGLEDLQQDWNKDSIEAATASELSQIVVYSRDWTVETILIQIQQGNIDLNPKFQRRNAWNDEKRSLLIESLIINVPVPQIVFAEDPNKRKAFIIIDGKQRLLTLAGFASPETYDYWEKPRLQGLESRPELNGLSLSDLKLSNKWAEVYRQLMNADIRCTVISNYSQDAVLYDIFHRVNTGSVPLSTQELRFIGKV